MSREDSKLSTVVNAAAVNLARTQRGRKQWLSIAIDTLAIWASIWVAYSLRLGEVFTDFSSTWYLFAALPPVTVLIFLGFGIYRWVVRSSNLRLYLQIAKGVAASSVALLAVMYLFPPEPVSPRSVFLIYALVLTAISCGLRMLWRRWFGAESTGLPVAIYGAGSAGRQLASTLVTDSQFRPVCFIDDSPDLDRSTVLGLPVYSGTSVQLKDHLHKKDVRQVIIAIPSLNNLNYQQVVQRVGRLQIPFKTLPSIVELISGQASISEVRDISIKDILGRSEVVPDPALMKSCISGKSILVTGGGGSIGSELCRQIIRLGPSKLTVLDNCEANLYHITEEINALNDFSNSSAFVRFDAVLHTVTDASRINKLFETSHFDTVFHAAAYKHVPIVEHQPEQGVEVNVFGTLNLVDAAIATNVSDFVLISTDKAVRPTNAMGCTKRIAELILQAKAELRHNTRISMVRFGNVLASNGSVVPKFIKQIESGGPVTLTHPDITRYFMTIPEASQLVVQACAVAKGGDVFVLDMGEPVKISDLADTIIRVYQRRIEQAGGKAPDIKVETVGLRPGEKMYEELFIDDNCTETLVTKVFAANEKFLSWHVLEPLLLELRELSSSASAPIIKGRLLELVSHPEMTSRLVRGRIDTIKEANCDVQLSIVS